MRSIVHTAAMGLSISGFLLLGLLLWLPATSHAAPRYIDAPPLAQSLAGIRVADVSGKLPLQVPIITWGGDIATILANGGKAGTQGQSPFDSAGLNLKLVREDVFAKQVEAYLSGKSPYLRGTLGMINMAAERLAKDPRTKPVLIYQMTWSSGGDALVVKPGIHKASDLKGRTIALQAYGPHVDYMTKVLADAGLSPADVILRWLPDLTGTGNSPMAAFQQRDVDAAFVIIPDAMVLTSGGTVGSGAEDSVKGARLLLSTRTANRIVADVYAVRSDYLAANRQRVQGFVSGLLQGQEKLRKLMKAGSGGKAYRQLMGSAAELLLDTTQAVADVEGLYADAEFVGWQGNVDFFTNASYPRSMTRLTAEIQDAFAGLGLTGGRVPLADAGWDYQALRAGLETSGGSSSAQRFDQDQVAAVLARKQRQGTLGEGELFSFDIYFQPNQNEFSADLYQDAFAKVIEYASTYGGALITIEGHSDPLGYLRKKKEGGSELVLGRVKQSAKNLSLSRAGAVRNSVIGFARKQGVNLDPSQFALLGHGIARPSSGVCGADPCAPKTEQEWRDNMRVEFRIMQVEAESSVFKPL